MNKRRCPVCRERQRVTLAGLLVKHKRGPKSVEERADAILGGFIGGRWQVQCEGSGVEP